MQRVSRQPSERDVRAPSVCSRMTRRARQYLWWRGKESKYPHVLRARQARVRALATRPCRSPGSISPVGGVAAHLVAPPTREVDAAGAVGMHYERGCAADGRTKQAHGAVLTLAEPDSDRERSVQRGRRSRGVSARPRVSTRHNHPQVQGCVTAGLHFGSNEACGVWLQSVRKIRARRTCRSLRRKTLRNTL